MPMQAVSNLAFPRPGPLRLALAATVLLFASTAADAFTTRAGPTHGGQVDRAKPARMTKLVPFKTQKPEQPAKPEAAASAKPTEHAGTWTAGEGARACFRSRRKLWQAEEGWVVKKVNVCP